MPKNLPPTEGFNAKDELKKFEADPSSFLGNMVKYLLKDPNQYDQPYSGQPDLNSISCVAADLRGEINEGRCMTKDQYSGFLSAINIIAILRNEIISRLNESAKRPKKFGQRAITEEELNNGCSAQELWDIYREKLSALVSKIQHYEHECRDCLNADCKKRDKGCPINKSRIITSSR